MDKSACRENTHKTLYIEIFNLLVENGDNVCYWESYDEGNHSSQSVIVMWFMICAKTTRDADFEYHKGKNDPVVLQVVYCCASVISIQKENYRTDSKHYNISFEYIYFLLKDNSD